MENTERINDFIKRIHSSGVLFSVIVTVALNSVAAFLIAVIFAVLEYWRVKHGALALGQSSSQASLIAVALVAFNALHPIYSLRSIQERGYLEVTKPTLRTWLANIWARIIDPAKTERVNLWHNPVLEMVATFATFTTIILAVFDLLAPILLQLFEGVYVEPLPMLLIKLLMGLGLSVVGVYALQASSHELGVIMYRKIDQLGINFAPAPAKIEQEIKQVTQQVNGFEPDPKVSVPMNGNGRH